MAAAILNQGISMLRDAIRNTGGNFIADVGVSDDTTAFNATQTTLNPGAGGTVTLIQTASFANVDFQTVDCTVTITGATQFTNKVINTIGLLWGATATTCISRTLRGAGLGIGVQSGDLYTIGVRYKIQDDS